MHLDVQSIGVARSLASLASAATLVALVRYAPRVPGVAWWAIAFGTLATGCASFAIQFADWRLNALLYNIPITIWPVLLLGGSRRFAGLPPANGGVAALIAFAAAAAVLFTFGSDLTPTRVTVLSLVFSTALTGNAVALWNINGVRWPARSLAAVFVAGSVLFLVRPLNYALSSIPGLVRPETAAGAELVAWCGTLLTVIVSAPLLVMLVASRLRDEIDAEKRQTAESEARYRALASRLDATREEERGRVAHNLHDNIAQDLAGLAFLVHGLGVGRGTEIVAMLDDTIEKLRSVAAELRPAELAMLPLSDAVKARAASFQLASGIPVEVESAPMDVPDSVRVAFYRAVEEALANVARHSRATRVTIKLHLEHDRPVMRIHDDGIGVKDDDLRKVNALGLLAVHERVVTAGGRIAVEPGRTCGTTLTVYGPSLGATWAEPNDSLAADRLN